MPSYNANVLALDPHACPACGESFSTREDLRVPCCLTCGHNVCRECADAMTLADEPACTICRVALDATTPYVQNIEFGRYCDVHGGPLGVPIEDRPPPPSEPKVYYCKNHGDVLASHFCDVDGSVLCGACAAGYPHKVLAVGEELRAFLKEKGECILMWRLSLREWRECCGLLAPPAQVFDVKWGWLLLYACVPGMFPVVLPLF